MLRMLRLKSVFQWMWIVLWGSVLAALSLMLWPVFNPWVDPTRRVAERLNHLWAVGIRWVFPRVRIEVSGRQYLEEAAGPFVICPNHQSVADIIMLLVAW